MFTLEPLATSRSREVTSAARFVANATVAAARAIGLSAFCEPCAVTDPLPSRVTTSRIRVHVDPPRNWLVGDDAAALLGSTPSLGVQLSGGLSGEGDNARPAGSMTRNESTPPSLTAEKTSECFALTDASRRMAS